MLEKRTQGCFRGDKRVASVLDDLRSTVKAVGGAGLAAPQIGVGIAACVWVDGEGKIQELVNPVIVKRGSETIREYEACLSIPGVWGEVERHREVWVEAKDRQWKTVSWHLRGWSARVVQHEIDHLAGILFTKRALGPLLNAEEMAAVRAERDLAEAQAAGAAEPELVS